jgi:hypothetical protein
MFKTITTRTAMPMITLKALALTPSSVNPCLSYNPAPASALAARNCRRPGL